MNEQVSQQASTAGADHASPKTRRRRKMPRKQILDVELQSANRFKGFGSKEALVEDLLLFGEASVMAAPANTGKTSIVAAIAAHAAAGAPLGGRAVARTATIFVAAEDDTGVLVRGATALKKHAGRKLPFDVFGEDIDLTNAKVMKRFCDDIEDHMREHRMRRLFIVFDTLNLCIGDSDENSSGDMRKAIRNAIKSAKRLNAHVMVIHHTSHADPKRARGSSSIGATADTVLVLEEASNLNGDKLVKISSPKQRNLAKDRSSHTWRLGVDDLGTCRKGKAITAPFAEPYIEEGDVVTVVPSKSKTSTPSLQEQRKQHLLEILHELDKKQPGTFHAIADVEGHLSTPFEAAKAKPESLRKAMRRVCSDLAENNLIEISSDGSIRVRS